MKRETAEKAARWWGDHLRNGSPLDNGDPSLAGGMTMMLGLSLQVDTLDAITEEQIKAFEGILANHIELREDWLSFGVDYHPDRILGEALFEAGIETNIAILPWKTHMTIKDDTIKASLGYRAESKVVE